MLHAGQVRGAGECGAVACRLLGIQALPGSDERAKSEEHEAGGGLGVDEALRFERPPCHRARQVPSAARVQRMYPRNQ